MLCNQMIEKLPIGKNPKPIKYTHFPTRHQAVIWRNWELVPVSRLADVLQATENQICKCAEEIGLPVPPDVEDFWLARGYLTIIRANWHLLPYEQLLALLGWSPEKLAFTLKEEDFLWTKLGNLKPAAQPVYYMPLNERQAGQTRQIKEIIKEHFSSQRHAEKPFGFIRKFKDGTGKCEYEIKNGKGSKAGFDPLFIYSYSAVYGDPLLHPELDPFPDGMLEGYAEMGVTGIWLPVILYTLYPLANAPEFSKDWEQRIKTLKKLVERAAKYELGVYLYLNEPRGMGNCFFDKYPEWRGVFHDRLDSYALCTSNKPVLDYLRNACAHVFSEVPALAGAFTITFSENPTHCHSNGQGHNCPLCSKRTIPEVIVEVNKAIEEGIHSVAPSAKVIVWNWGTWFPEWDHEAVGMLPDKVEFMAVSENCKPLNIGGVRNEIYDYSISQPGPSQSSVELWNHAKKRGLKTVAKVQLNNSWECASMPYIPVPYLIKEHLDNLKKAGVNGLMLSWTFGGYPGGNLELLCREPEELALNKFGVKAAPYIIESWKLFSNAFKNFPFHVLVLYNGPHNYGPMNLLYADPTGYASTMVGFPYDDLDGWRVNYPADVFERQFKILSEEWRRGLDLLCESEKYVDADKTDNFTDLKNVAFGAYCHFRSTYLQIRFVRIRNNKDKLSQLEIIDILDEEILLAEKLHEIVLKDSRIGFEAGNHYAYTANDLCEKVINCENLKRFYRVKFRIII